VGPGPAEASLRAPDFSQGDREIRRARRARRDEILGVRAAAPLKWSAARQWLRPVRHAQQIGDGGRQSLHRLICHSWSALVGRSRRGEERHLWGFALPPRCSGALRVSGFALSAMHSGLGTAADKVCIASSVILRQLWLGAQEIGSSAFLMAGALNWKRAPTFFWLPGADGALRLAARWVSPGKAPRDFHKTIRSFLRLFFAKKSAVNSSEVRTRYARQRQGQFASSSDSRLVQLVISAVHHFDLDTFYAPSALACASKQEMVSLHTPLLCVMRLQASNGSKGDSTCSRRAAGQP